MKRPQPLPERATACYDLLRVLALCPLPIVCCRPDEIDRILALRSAALLEAVVDSVILQRSGERTIGRAVVTRITAEGRAACTLRDAKGPASSWRRS
ncbi:MAG: hypothetical protein EOP82_09495 [Variovorax sp.]|nr:MAG: hypothetical protein EOP82_09495 [Variovorax sp.]